MKLLGKKIIFKNGAKVNKSAFIPALPRAGFKFTPETKPNYPIWMKLQLALIQPFLFVTISLGKFIKNRWVLVISYNL